MVMIKEIKAVGTVSGWYRSRLLGVPNCKFTHRWDQDNNSYFQVKQ